MFCWVCGNGGRRAWRTTVSPTCWTPFPFRPMHVRLVWCWPACVWSVYGHVVAAAAVMLVHSCLRHLMVGLFGVGSLALQRSLKRSDDVPVVVMPVSVWVGCARVGLCTTRRVTSPVVVSRRVDAVCCVRCTVGRPAGAQSVALSRCCFGLVEGGLSGVCFVVLCSVFVPRILLVCRCLSRLVLGLGCRCPGRLRAGMVGFGLVVFWSAPCAACFVGSAASSPPFGRPC